MSSRIWKYDVLEDPAASEEIGQMVRQGKLSPDAGTWREGVQDETFPAAWHVPIWFTHPQIYPAEPRSLVRVYEEAEENLLDEETVIWAEGETESRSLGQFSWSVEITLETDESTPAGGENLGWEYDVFISYSQKDRGAAETARAAEKIVPLALEPVEALLPMVPGVFRGLPIADPGALAQNAEGLLRSLGAGQVPGQKEGIVVIGEAHVDLTKLPLTFATRLYGRDRQMADLFAAWDSGAVNVFAYDAMGGAGKTALTYHFVQNLKVGGWRGARAVFAWSFYSQGSNEDRQTDADEFFKAAFHFFTGENQEPPVDAHEKGAQLAKLVQNQRSLLILDGLQPLQYATGKTGGWRSSTGNRGGIRIPASKRCSGNWPNPTPACASHRA